MSYVLEALLVRGHDSWPAEISERAGPAAGIYSDRRGTLMLVPRLRTRVSREATEALDQTDPVVLGFLELRRSDVELAEAASMWGSVAYVHAEFQGGGFQAAVGWVGGQIAFGPRFTATSQSEAEEDYYEVIPPPVRMAIDEALAFLGVIADDGMDEFDTVGLGRHRSSYQWTEPDQH